MRRRRPPRPEEATTYAVSAPAATPTASAGAEPSPASLLRSLLTVGPPVTIATALLFYFGWATSAAQSTAMGLDVGIFGMGTTDFVLRSLDALFVPVLAGCTVLLGWVALHARVLRARAAAAPGRTPRVVFVARQAWWVVGAVAGLVVLLWPPGRGITVPLALAAVVLLLEYRGRLRGRREGEPTGLKALRSTLVGVLVTALLFWEVANVAEVVGRGRAVALVAGVDRLTPVVVLSEDDLRLDAPGTRVTRDDGARYRYRYEGLRLLHRGGDTWFLVPDGWRPGQAPLVSLPDSAGVRLEFGVSSP